MRYRISKNGISIGIRMLYFVFHFVSTIFINRTLTTELKGEYAYIINMVSLLAIVGSLGLDLLYLEYKKRYGDSVLSSFLGLTLISSAFFVVVALISLCPYGNKEISYIFLLTAGHILYQNISIFACVYNVQWRNITLLAVQIVYDFSLVLLFVFNVVDVGFFLIAYLLNDLFVCLFFIIECKMKVSWVFLRNAEDGWKKNISVILSKGFRAMLISLLIAFNYNLDVIMLRKFNCDFSLIGIYSVGVTLSNIVLLVPDAFKEVLLGKVVRENSVKTIRQYIKISIVFMLVMLLGFGVLGKFFIRSFYGEEYVEAYYITLILFVGDIFMCLYKIIHPLFIADGKRKNVLLFLLIAVVFNFVMNVFTIPKYSIYGAAVSSVGSYFVTGVLFYFYFINEYGQTSKI